MFNRIKDEKGFTLIELLVVILIIGILIAVALPSFLGQQDKAQVSKLKQQMNAAYKAAKADAIDAPDRPQGQYEATPADLVAAITASEPQLTGTVTADVVAAEADVPAAGDFAVGQTTAEHFSAVGVTPDETYVYLSAPNNGATETGDTDTFSEVPLP